MLELQNVSKRYGEVQALHPTSLAFPPGKTTALLGTSGCGKSTLLRIVVGLVQTDTGAVLFDGQAVNEQGIYLMRQQIGYMIQDGGLFPHLTLRENIMLMGRFLHRPPGDMRQRISDLAAMMHLPEERLDLFPTQVSGGQRQRVALMRALFLDPQALLLDEPMGALDPLIRAELQEELQKIFRELGKTVIIVTHDLSEAGFLADHLVLMSAGRIVQQGTLAEMVHSPADEFVTRFVNAQRGPLDALEKKL
jgi:osmoprotectant transport system ATP-binding protein